MNKKTNTDITGAIAKPSFITTIIRWHFYLLIALIPLIFWLDTQTIFTLPKLVVLQTLSLSAIFFMLYDLFVGESLNLRWQKCFWPLLFWIFSLLLSTIFTINQYSSLFGQYGRFWGFFTMLNFALIPIFLFHYFNVKDLPKILRLHLIVSTLVAAYGLLQYFNFFGLWSIDFNWSDSPQNRVFSTIGHANHLGSYLATSLALIIYSGLFKIKSSHTKFKTWSTRAFYLLIALLHSTALILTASRGAILAFLLTVAVLSILILINHWPKLKSKFIKILATLGLTIIILSGIIYFSWPSLSTLGLFKRTEATVQTINKGQVPDRLSFLYSSFSMFQAHPLTGTGLGTFRDAYSAFRRTDYLIDGPGNAQFITIPESSHDEYSNILATQGIIGILAYLSLIITTLLILGRGYLHSKDQQFNHNLPLLSALLIYLFQTLFNFGEIVNLTLLYSIIGLAFVSNSHLSKIKLFSFKTPFWAKIFITIPAIGAIIWLLVNGIIPELKADYLIKRAKAAEFYNNIQLAESNWIQATKLRPSEYSIAQSLADFQIKQGILSTNRNDQENFLKKAAQNYLKAIDLNNNYPSSYHNLALTYIELYKLTKLPPYLDLAKDNFQIAVQKSPNNPRFIYEYARQLHSQWNNPEQSIKLLKQALQIAPYYQEPQDYLNFLYKNYPQLSQNSH